MDDQFTHVYMSKGRGTPWMFSEPLKIIKRDLILRQLLKTLTM